ATGTNSIIVSPTSSTVYAVSGTSSLACTASRNISVTVNSAAPALTVSATSNSVCLGDSVSITTTGALSYTYTGGISDGTYFYPAATGNYSITGGNACGTTNTFVTVTVTPLPVGAVAIPTLVCAGSPATLTAAGAQSYSWMPGGSGSSIVVTPLSAMVYTVEGKDGAC